MMKWQPFRVFVLTLSASSPIVTFGDEPTKPTASASESNPAVPAAGHSIHGEAFNDGPRQLATIVPGMGKVHFPVTTSNPEAQAFIEQGVGQLHSYYYLEAERSFRQAAKLDPELAMAYWGMAMANVNNEKRARGFLAEARKRDSKVSAREKLYLDALSALYAQGVDEKQRKKSHLLALETLVQEYPDDLDARAWMAMVTWQNAGSDGIGSRQAVDLVLESILQAEPSHPGAHHYRIHLWDGVKPIRAEKSAGLYAGTAPGIAHAWHMPGHTYTGLKRYADAAYQQEGSARVDHAAMLKNRTMPFEIHNYAHNNQWLATSLSNIGRVRQAIEVARNLVEQPRDPEKNGKNDGGSAQRSGRTRWSEILARYELWDDLLAVANSGLLDWSDNQLERRERAYSLGLAYAAKGDSAKLEEQVDAVRNLMAEEAKSGRKNDGGNKPIAFPYDQANPMTRSALCELEGYQHLAKGEISEAFERFAKATSMRPEALARAHIVARNFGFAESTAKKAVESQENQFAPLAAQVEVLHAAGNEKGAQEAYARLVPFLKTADQDLPVLVRLRPILAVWKEANWTAPAASPNAESSPEKPPLAPLGSLTWTPSVAPDFTANDTTGKPWSLAKAKGKNVLVLFYLGGKCPHCMQQLQEFGKEMAEFAKLDTELVAISTDDLEATKALKENQDGVKFPMPLLADPKLDIFRSYRAFDDFESSPLHGTFLIDAQGAVRFQRISADPFLDVAFLKDEVARVNRLVPPVKAEKH